MLTDIFPNKGLKLKAGSLAITDLTEGTDYTLSDNGVDGFTITFDNPRITAHTTIYTTIFTANDRDNKSVWFTKNATLSWDGAGNSKTVTSSFTPDTFTQQNGLKRGKYNAITKEITAEENATGVVVKDITKQLVLDEDYILQFHGTSNDDQSFELTFIEGIERASGCDKWRYP